MTDLTTSRYRDISSRERNALVYARRIRRDAGTADNPFNPALPENEVPKCAAVFDHDADCDIRSSHLCGPDEMTLAIAAMFQEVQS